MGWPAAVAGLSVAICLSLSPSAGAPSSAASVPSVHPGISGQPGTWWHPGPVTSWQYDLGWPVAVPTNVGPVQVYDIDYDGSEDGTQAQVTALVARIHEQGGHAICYTETGAWENYRPDAGQYPASVLGAPMQGYPDERYVDIRQWSVLEPILDARFRQCKAEGFDGVETDIDDSYTDDTGFPLTLQDEVTFDTEVAHDVHALGLAWFLKNGVDGDAFITDIEPVADGTVNEQCWQYNECSQLEPFAKAGKPILNVEYQDLGKASTCAQAQAFPMATVHTDVNLDGAIAWGCWPSRGNVKGPVISVAVPPARHGPGFAGLTRLTATVGHPLSFPIKTSGYPVPALSHSALPPGLRWANRAGGTATIAGVPGPTAAGVSKVTVMASNPLGNSKQVLTITVEGPPAITSRSQARAVDGATFSFTVRTRGYPYPRLTHSALPKGLKWSAGPGGTAEISGRAPADALGVHHVKIKAKNPLGTANQVLEITVF